ncbi:hypothetical protein N7478_009381 [Penicillium angulare]|uniref:uncharacterized protein n=1 Tax=Penicillium angulare TaxID=116970 RepID=UPI0025409CF5|nr:uncharacterized protein N7478_009381 [Penicillium angulare]KAJ5266573.1 hypothetical protein N7478_009381 [Penicillium angulare]
MPLPPEQINIKRRREEEPVETLYIQSALHQTKRRFTDYVFQRVTISGNGSPDDSDSSAPPHPAAQRLLRSPRSVSSLQIPNRRAAARQAVSSTGVPRVRATSPGAEIREAQRLAAARKEADEKRQRALQSPSTPQIDSQVSSNTSGASTTQSARGSDSEGVPPSPGRGRPLRRFQISKSIGSNLGSLRASRGIKKRRADSASPGVAVLVEQLQRRPHSRQASLIADLVNQAQNEALEDVSVKSANESESTRQPRKRPVVNQAEKKWKEERQNAVSAAKLHLSETLEKSAQAQQSTWDEESERLAKQFEQVALEIEREMETDPPAGNDTFAPPPSRHELPFQSPKPLKHQPRPPKQPRAVPNKKSTEIPETQSRTETQPATDNDSDNDYVYDVYIRRPLAEMDMLANPLAEAESDERSQNLETSNLGIGIIVITAEDEEYWEHFVEDDEEEWDSEDADSNAENNPANDYPEDELSSSDEEDDPTAIYGKYRHRAASDDEEFDFDNSGSENGAQYGSRFTQWRQGAQMDSDDDTD